MKKLFSNSNYRFGVETCLLMYLNTYQMVLAADLDDYSKTQDTFDKENPCNLYFILRRPKITVDPESIKTETDRVSMDILIHKPDETIRSQTVIEFYNAKPPIEHYTEYPYNLVAFKDSEKPLLIGRPSTMLDQAQESPECKDLDYEVLYVGQAFGKKGDKNAIDRLSKHETLLKIFADTSLRYPDSDIYVLLSNFTQQSILFSAGRDLINVADEDKPIEEEKIKHLTDNNGINLTDKQRLNLTEAAIIRYFEPEYNIEFANSFPNENHKSYSECYDLDIRSMVVELDTSEMRPRLYSEKRERSEYHQATYDFQSREDRFSFLNFGLD